MSAITELEDILLRILTDTTAQTKNSQLTWQELDTNIIKLINAILFLNQNGGNFDEYNPATTYQPAPPTTYVSYENNVYIYIGETAASGQTPDVSPTFWEIVSAGDLAHAQNTDYKLIDKIITATANETIVLNADYNVFNIDSEDAVIINTLTINHNSIFVIYNESSYSLALTTDGNILCPNNKGFELESGDYCICKKLPNNNVAILFTTVQNLELITSQTVIDAIILNSNWDDTGDFTGSTTGLYENDYYIDATNKVKYEFKNNNLIRMQFNNFNL